MTSNDKSAHSSDLEFARWLSHRLRGPRGGEVALAPPAERAPRYVRFDASRFGDRSPGETRVSHGSGFGPDVWNQLLDGVLSAADADSAFLMDEHGLVVASRGATHGEEAEALGARLMLTLDQTAMMSEMPRSSQIVCAEVGDSWLTGIRNHSDGMLELTLGIIGRTPVSRDARSVIENLLVTMTGVV